MSSVPRVPETSRMAAEELTADQAWATVRRTGWWTLGRATFWRFRYGDGFTSARALAVQLCLAAVPLVIATIGLSSSLHAQGMGEVLRRTLLWLTPGASEAVLQDALTLSQPEEDDSAEAALWLGLLAALVALTTAMGQIERGANRIYGIQRDRPSGRKYVRAGVMALVCGMPAMAGFLLVVASSAFGRAVEQVYGFPAAVVVAIGWPAGAVLMLGSITVMFSHSPHRRQPGRSWLALGAGVSLLLSLLFTGLLAGLLHLLNAVGGIYGPLTAVMALLVWAQTTAASIFLGLTLCAQLEATRASSPPRPSDNTSGWRSVHRSATTHVNSDFTRAQLHDGRAAVAAVAGPGAGLASPTSNDGMAFPRSRRCGRRGTKPVSRIREAVAPSASGNGQDSRGIGRFGARSLLGLGAVLVGAVPFLTLLVGMQHWAPLQTLDDDVAAGLNDLVAGSPRVVRVLGVLTDAGDTGTAIYVLVLTTLWLLIRRQHRLATYVAVTGLGLAVLLPVTKALIGRARPDVALPVVTLPSNASFPSGHAMTSLVTWGVVVLVALPALRPARRRWLIAGAVLLVVVVGLTRLALGVHFVSDVVAGWALGAAWLSATTAAFRGWEHDQGRPTPALSAGLQQHAPPALHLAPARPPLLPQGRRSVLQLTLAWTGVFAVVSSLGLLTTGVLANTVVGRFDTLAVHAALIQRTDALNSLADKIRMLSDTRTVVFVAVAETVLVLAATANWRPVLFVALSVVGEGSLYGGVTHVVGRPRPDVPDLTTGLPVGASFPSGHVGAAVAVYGALAVLVIVYARNRWRWAALAVPVVLVPVIGLSRVYEGAHHPTDVMAGALLGVLWLLALTRIVFTSGGLANGVVSGVSGSTRSVVEPSPSERVSERVRGRWA